MTIQQLPAPATIEASVAPEAVPVKRAVLYLRVSTSRQATRNGEAEGYSIPAQRSACERKVSDLGAEVVREFVDAGASARSADRDGLQALLAYVAEGGVNYVVVHKLDRLARDRADDVMILAKIQTAGATLVSVSEQIDETPAGMLMHNIFAGMAEFYSRNLANEAKKGIAQKAMRGGTHGVAPIGYMNTLTRIEGLDIKGVAFDEEKAEHIRWAFQTYAAGHWSISTLRDELEERGLKSRTTLKYIGTPLNNSQVHRMLSNPYYMGKIRHRDVIYDGVHEPLIDAETWHHVQDVLAARRIAGDRSWRHTHYLKGSLVCHRCGGRMGYGHSRGKGGVYSYFFCLGRHTGRTDCDLPYISVEKVEEEIERIWKTQVQFTQQTIEEVGELSRAQLDARQEQDQSLLANQSQRLVKLERKKQKLIDAYLDEAIPVEDLKQRQAAVLVEIHDANRLVAACQQNMELVRKHLELVLLLLGNAGRLYQEAVGEQRKWLNQAVFASIAIDLTGDNEPHPTQETLGIQMAGELAEPVAAVTGMGQLGTNGRKARDSAGYGPTGAKNGSTCGSGRQNETPGQLALSGGFNVTNLAETERFELSVPLRVLHLSRVVH
ncbi:DNA invertase Pin-like site-specific DNA recombinase [Rhodoglobus vestalii]|uniref:DNA invertase Pin-like site-specific DNA recombinase n=1 Tax=Rhodoglobus vestalii TaxID=193384 RepID=A0A8H2K6H5_9MICO|nr:DNA invertase Pin-like site-specific DNA recombinase [Rhodoglobus vestalii]